jgi:hypothetical protein
LFYEQIRNLAVVKKSDFDKKMNSLKEFADIINQYQETLSKYGPDVNLKIVTSIGTWIRPAILVHSEKNSIELDKYQSSGLYPGESFVGVYWWCHAVIARDWFRYAQYDPLLKKQKSVTHDFLIYNRAWAGTREYRLKFTELLVQNNLVEHCKTWFNNGDSEKLYHEHVFQNPNFQIENFNLQDYFSETTAPATSSADYNSNDYQCTNLEVVLETLFDDTRLHLTEKSLRPIACGHPFILAATAGSLEYLRSYGFETFNGLIDESYDTIQDPLKRLQAICAEMKRISQLPDTQKEQLFRSMNQIALRNQQKFFSTDWQQSIVNEFKANFMLACKKIDGILKYPV